MRVHLKSLQNVLILPQKHFSPIKSIWVSKYSKFDADFKSGESDSYVPLYNRFHRGEWITRVSGGEGALDTPGPLNGTSEYLQQSY